METLEVKHTPGPWLRDGKTIYSLTHAGWRKGIEQFKNRFSATIQGDFETPIFELEANADLIAAAPELLKALRQCHFVLKQHPDIYPHGGMLAEKAIAKAEGRA